MKMRALTIQQPFAFGIVNGLKRVENRSWTVKYRGPVAIHAGANRNIVAAIAEESGDEFDSSIFQFGAVVGVADLVDVVPLNPDIEDEPTAEGPICWIFANPRILPKAVPAKGKTSLFYLSEEESAAVAEQLVDAREPQPGEFEWMKQFIWVDETVLLEDRMRFYIDQQQYQWAESCLNRLLDRDPTNADYYRQRGLVRCDEGNLAVALEDCNHAIALAPMNGWNFWARSMVLSELGEQEKADSDYQKAIELSPELVETLNKIAAEQSELPSEEE